MKKFFDTLSEILKAIVAILLLAIVVIVLFQVFARAMKISTPWTEELARYALIWLTFLGAPAVYHEKAELMVDLCYTKFPTKVRQWMHLFFDLCIIAFCCYLIVAGFQLCQLPSTLKFVSPASGVPRVYVYAAMPIGSVLLLLFVLYDIPNVIKMIQGKIEDTTAQGMIDESKTLAEMDAEKGIVK